MSSIFLVVSVAFFIRLTTPFVYSANLLLRLLLLRSVFKHFFFFYIDEQEMAGLEG